MTSGSKLGNHDILDRGIYHDERPCGDAGSETHDEHAAWPRVNKRRDMPNHALQAHVGWRI